MKSSRMPAKTDNAKTATKLLVALTGGAHGLGKRRRATGIGEQKTELDLGAA
jgi:hypothetical protein